MNTRILKRLRKEYLSYNKFGKYPVGYVRRFDDYFDGIILNPSRAMEIQINQLINTGTCEDLISTRDIALILVYQKMDYEIVKGWKFQIYKTHREMYRKYKIIRFLTDKGFLIKN